MELVGVTTIKPSDVEIKEVIGEGAFGVVYRGILNGSITVAVKQLKLKAGATAADVYNRKLTEFLNEAAMMRYLTFLSFYFQQDFLSNY